MQSKMNLSDHVIAWQHLYRASLSLEQLTFETLIFRFVQTTQHLTKSSPKAELERAIETFRIQYYNKFMHNRSGGSKECVKFIELFQTFSQQPHKKKGDYMTFIRSCFEFYKGSVGGSSNGMPLLCNFSDKCLQSPQYFKIWHEDEVKSVRNQMDITENRCAFCVSKSVSLSQLRPGYCPANLLPWCGKCDPKEHPDIVSSYLEKTARFCLPAPTPTVTQYLNEMNRICSDMVINPNEPLIAYKHRLDEHAVQVHNQHKNLRQSYAVLERKIEDLVVVQKHIVDDNEEYRISMANLTRQCSIWEKRFQEVSDSNHRLNSACETMKTELSEVNHKFRESVQAQWYYYNLATNKR